MKANKENLIECLEQIGWSVKGFNNIFYIYNQKGKDTYWQVFNDRLELNRYAGSFDESPVCCFYFKSCKLQWLEKDTICLTAKGSGNSVFLFFANYNKELRKD